MAPAVGSSWPRTVATMTVVARVQLPCGPLILLAAQGRPGAVHDLGGQWPIKASSPELRPAGAVPGPADRPGSVARGAVPRRKISASWSPWALVSGGASAASRAMWASSYSQDRWVPLRRGTGRFLIADTQTGLEHAIQDDYWHHPVPRDCDPPGTADYLNLDDGDVPADGDVPDEESRFILAALRYAFRAWTITYSPQLRAWIARARGKTICQNSQCSCAPHCC